ncbi:DNA-methyltransferase (plasmid) [Carnobacterium maltaromaticum]|uniref:DNA-methyltransferase n=1 Tax=Carnobacterium maltaromaticum TaxID=2751 RepID=UPI0034502C5B
MEINTIFNEECLKGMERLPAESIDAIICDLPYGTTACSWDTIIPFDKLWEQYRRIIKKNGAIVLFGAEPFSTALRASNLGEYKYDWYWVKNNSTGFAFAKKQPMRSVETISVFCKGTARYYPQGLVSLNKTLIRERRSQSKGDIYNTENLSGKEYFQEFSGYPNNVLKFNKESKHCFHPTQKPVELLEYLIKTYTKKNELILDNCMGSGTTAIAAINTERNYIGFEMDQEYYHKSLKRIKENTTQLNIFGE